MAATIPQTPSELTTAEQFEDQIAAALVSLEGAERLLWQLDAGSVFDIGTALLGARAVLQRALLDIPQPECDRMAA